MSNGYDPSDMRMELLAAPIYMAMGAVAGLLLASFALLVGAARMVIAILGGASLDFSDLLGIFYYVAGFIVGGAVSGLMWPIRRWIGGYYGLGIVLMSFVLAAITYAEEGPVSNWTGFSWAVIILLSVVFGIALGHGAGGFDTRNG